MIAILFIINYFKLPKTLKYLKDENTSNPGVMQERIMTKSINQFIEFMENTVRSKTLNIYQLYKKITSQNVYFDYKI